MSNVTTGNVSAVNVAASGAVSGASGAFSSGLTAPTAVPGTNSTAVATTSFVQAAISGGSQLPGIVGLGIKNNATTPSTKIDITATAAVLTTAAGAAFSWNTGGTFTIDLGSNGAVNKLDAGSIAASTVYHVYLISNGTTTGGLASTSATSPTLPSGYTYFARAGAMITDGSSNLYRTQQCGRRTQYIVTGGTNTAAMRRVASGTVGNYTTPTWVAQNLTGFIPATATRVQGTNGAYNTCMATVAPNSAYGAYNSTSNPPPIVCQIGASSAANAFFDFELESSISTGLYWISSAAGGTLSILGWEDAVNAC